MNRRDFLKTALAAGGTGLLAPRLWAFDVGERRESAGRLSRRATGRRSTATSTATTRTFTWVCAPNDTHMCRLRAFVRNGVILRSEQNYDHDRCGDLYGNKATKAWNPRGCPKGYTMQRRVYGPYRLKGPVLRKGWKEWADAGFPSLSDKPELRTQYKFDDRGNDTFVRVTWDEAYKYLAAGPGGDRPHLQRRRGQGPAGQGRLRPADDRPGARGRHAHDQGRLESADPRRRSASSASTASPTCWACSITTSAACRPNKARGARDWNEYTWRGDQAPGHPFVHGLQTSDMDMNDLRFSQAGHPGRQEPDREQDARVALAQRGHGARRQAGRHRPGVQLPRHQVELLDRRAARPVGHGRVPGRHEDPDRREAGTTPTSSAASPTSRCWSAPTRCKRLRPEEVIKDYKPKDLKGGPSYTIQGLTDEQRDEDRRLLRLGREGGQGRRAVAATRSARTCRSRPR